ncbi:MAG TPA: serine hydrolase domain-containing protein [Longimicrobium sp.]|nr:serine hydrolase domain-containing protein [Longimicrobium sp.]
MSLPSSPRIVCLILLLAGISTSRAAAQPEPPAQTSPARRLTDAQVAREADRIARAYAALGRFSGSVLVAREGREVFARGYGLANRASGEAATPDTRFDIGSLGKQFTAAAILRLESEGRLSVNDPVSRHLPEYPRPAGDQITLHHLLTHTSGLPSLGRRGQLEHVKEDCTPRTLEELIAYSSALPLDFAPGSEHRYSNSGYALLAAVVERVAGMPFDEYLRTALFQPAGMQATGRPLPGEAPAGLAVGYTGYEPRIEPRGCVHMSWHAGAGGVHSTARDLLRWDQALAAGRILPAEQLAKFYQPHVQTGRAGRAYAYGWNRFEVHRRPVVHHNGGTEGFIAEFMRFPDDGLLVIVLANYLPDLSVNVPIRIVRAASAAVFGEAYEVPPLPVAVPAAELARLAGRYEAAPGYVVRVDTAGGRLWAEALGGQSWSLATIGAQRTLNPHSDTVMRGMRIIRAFVEGDVPTLRAALAPARRAEVSDSSLLFLKRLIETDPRFGPVRTISPLRVIEERTGPFVDARITFAHGEWFLRAELDPENRLMGWYYGSTLPARVELVPLGGAEFFADGFRWEEPDLRIRFTLRGGEPAEMVIDDDDGPITASRQP